MIDVQPVPIPVLFDCFLSFVPIRFFDQFIVKYSNINLHMQIELPKNILYNIILLAHLSTLHFYLSSSCVPICVIFRWLTYKCSGLLSHYTHLSCSSIADSYTYAQQYQNRMSIILPLKSYFHELKFPIPASYIQF